MKVEVVLNDDTRYEVFTHKIESYPIQQLEVQFLKEAPDDFLRHVREQSVRLEAGDQKWHVDYADKQGNSSFGLSLNKDFPQEIAEAERLIRNSSGWEPLGNRKSR